MARSAKTGPTQPPTRAAGASEYAALLATRRRRCFVYENLGRGFHLLLVDEDGGGGILAERIDDLDAALWLASLVNSALDALRRVPA